MLACFEGEPPKTFGFQVSLLEGLLVKGGRGG